MVGTVPPKVLEPGRPKPPPPPVILRSTPRVERPIGRLGPPAHTPRIAVQRFNGNPNVGGPRVFAGPRVQAAPRFNAPPQRFSAPQRFGGGGGGGGGFGRGGGFRLR